MKLWLGALAALALGTGCATTNSTLDAPVSFGSPRSTQGIVMSYLHGPGGVVDGVILQDGSRIRFPEAVGDRGTVVAPVGMSVAVVGHDAQDAKGHRFIEAEKVTNTSSNAELDFSNRPRPPETGIGGSGPQGTPAANDPR